MSVKWALLVCKQKRNNYGLPLLSVEWVIPLKSCSGTPTQQSVQKRPETYTSAFMSKRGKNGKLFLTRQPKLRTIVSCNFLSQLNETKKGPSSTGRPERGVTLSSVGQPSLKGTETAAKFCDFNG